MRCEQKIFARRFARTPGAGSANDMNMPNDPLYSCTEQLDSAQAATLVPVLDECKEYRSVLRAWDNAVSLSHSVHGTWLPVSVFETFFP